MAVYAGRLVLIKIDNNNVGGAGANWLTIAQQRGGNISRTSDTADATHKGLSGYPSAIITRIPWGFSADGALDPADPAWTKILADWAAKNKPWFQVDASGISGEKKEGTCIITDCSYEFPENDVVTYSLELQGDGSLNTSP